MNDTTDGPFGTFASLTLLISFEFDYQSIDTQEMLGALRLNTKKLPSKT